MVEAGAACVKQTEDVFLIFLSCLKDSDEVIQRVQ